jgi:predicted Rossmann fold nucleotide-binding protein DprA/Smf involved in DNA uptake
MPTSLAWLSSNDPAFPPRLGQYLGDKAPTRMCTIGNLNILKSKSVALICSVKCPGNIILQTYDLAQRLRDAGVSVIGGFHSPMEQECFRILLRGKQPVIVCPARGLHGMRIPSEHKQILEEGRLLYLSPFSEKVRRATVDAAQFRNRFVAALADKILVPYAAPGSKTLELCRLLLSWNKSVYTLANHANAPLIDLGAPSIGDQLFVKGWW